MKFISPLLLLLTCSLPALADTLPDDHAAHAIIHQIQDSLALSVMSMAELRTQMQDSGFAQLELPPDELILLLPASSMLDTMIAHQGSLLLFSQTDEGTGLQMQVLALFDEGQQLKTLGFHLPFHTALFTSIPENPAEIQFTIAILMLGFGFGFQELYGDPITDRHEGELLWQVPAQAELPPFWLSLLINAEAPALHLMAWVEIL
jgi:hypothetical protein